ncbi:MAG: NAD-dependent succinate-semialdehyde dehydrogenase [Bradyrhizobium sp.]|nr:NAD-dependent succinate-semialdehyde dehydrogenase [Bradyrhizobium sp.]
MDNLSDPIADGSAARVAYPSLYLFIAGQRVHRTVAGTMPVLNPATEEVIGTLPIAGKAELSAAVEAADRGFVVWSQMAPLARSNIMREAARIIRTRVDHYAACLVLEQGKTIVVAKAEWMSTAEQLDWSAEEGRRTYGRVIPGRNNIVTQTAYKMPVGPIAAFSPWNFPAWTAIQKVAPALAAGCSIVIKAAEETPASVLLIAEALTEAGLPPGVLNVVYGHPAEISSHLIDSPVIRKITFTGSIPVGRQLAAAAGRQLKRSTMELGGHGPVIIAHDADIEKAASLGAMAKYRNAGQVCVSPTRFLVQRDRYDQFLESFITAAKALKVGDGLDPETTMGPLANDRRIAAMEDFVADAEGSGGKRHTGGHRLNRPGYFFQPTVFGDVPTSSKMMNEEIFGPIAVINPFDQLEEAIDEANRLDYGLAAYCFSGSTKVADQIRRRVRTGMLAINHYAVALSETPFGGIRNSGFGAEGGTEGVEAYLETFYVTHMME